MESYQLTGVTATPTALEAAQHYASIGWPVFPVHTVTDQGCSCGNASCKSPGKHPMTNRGYKDASTDAGQIEQWFKTGNANIGIATGWVSGLLVLDIDPDDGGVEMFKQLQDDHGKLPTTLLARTGGAGVHAFYRMPKGIDIRLSAGKLGAGLDVRANGGYVVAPPSKTAGRYKWITETALPDCGQIADIPDWLTGLLVTRPAKVADPARRNSDLTGRASRLELAETPANVERVHSALTNIDPAPRDSWLHVGMALHSTGWSCGKTLWDEWSRQSLKFDEAGQNKGWESFSVRGEGITIGTLFHMAREAGWIDATAPQVPGDIANGRLFASMHRDTMRFVHPAGKWLQWNGSRWIWCEGGEALQAAKIVADRLKDEAADRWKDAPDNPSSKRELAHAAKSQQLNRLDAMLKLAASEKNIAVADINALDSDPMLLGVRNGVVDLRTGALLAARPDMLITRQCRAALIVNAHCPRWKQFLRDVFQGEEELIGYLQRAAGYTLTGLVSEEVMFFMYGHGANGKSVLANVIGEVMGDYAQMAPADLLTLRDNNGGARSDVARMAGARLVMANETQSGDRVNEQLVKTLVSRDKITARFLYQDHFEYAPTHKLWVRGNHKPIITGDDDGIWRRIHLIPFQRRFEEHERDTDLERKLLEERDGILGWMVEGVRLWLQRGLDAPKVVRRASDEYRQQSDVLGDWLQEECEQGPDEETEQQIAYTTYSRWCNDRGLKALSKKQFTCRLSERGYGERRGHRGRFYTGFRLRAAGT